MKVEIEFYIKPFSVPNFVIAENEANQSGLDGHKDGTPFPLSKLDPDTLERLCNEFTRAVFKKAGKDRPARAEVPSKRREV